MQLEFDFNKGKHVVVSLSGGMDSSTLLLKALDEYETVTALSFDYGQKHRVELQRAQSLIDYLNDNCNENNCYKGLFWDLETKKFLRWNELNKKECKSTESSDR